MSALSKTVQNALLADAQAQAAAYAAPYAELAAKLATGLAAAKSQTDKAKETRTSVWDGFKSAIGCAMKASHTETAMRVGLEVACTEHGIPAGSFRGYVSTVANLYRDVKAGELTLDQVKSISVADARKRYREVSPEQAMREKIASTIKDWNAEQLALLCNLLGDIVPETSSQDDDSEQQEDGEQEQAEAIAA